MTRRAACWACRLALLGAKSGCSASPASDDQTAPDTYLAFASDFAQYRSWSHAPANAEGAPSASPHSVGPMTVYWNRDPPSGSTGFPVGTIIVKQTDPSVTSAQIFAMVKRGGGYNAAGARNWEWFELQVAAPDPVTILWRGVGPPNGESYGGDPTTCNTCHGQAARNDFVWSTALQLDSF